MIGSIVNKVCDFFDKPSTVAPTPRETQIMVWLVYGLTIMSVAMVLCLVNLFVSFGVFAVVLDFLVPIREGFWTTAWAFIWHWGLIMAYGLFVMPGLLDWYVNRRL